MSTPFFTDSSHAPTPVAVRAALGRAAVAWRTLFERLHAEHPDLEQSWRYYDDGKSWLLKVTRGSRTVCWVLVEKNAFTVSFYFPDRLTAALLESELGDERKDELRSHPPAGKLRRVAVRLGPARAVRDVLTLVALKKTLG